MMMLVPLVTAALHVLVIGRGVRMMMMMMMMRGGHRSRDCSQRRRCRRYRGRMVERWLERQRGRRRAVGVWSRRSGRCGNRAVPGRRSLLRLAGIPEAIGDRGSVAALVLLLLLKLQFHGGRGHGRQTLRGWRGRTVGAATVLMVMVAAQRGCHCRGGLQLLLVMVMREVLMMVAAVQQMMISQADGAHAHATRHHERRIGRQRTQCGRGRWTVTSSRHGSRYAQVRIAAAVRMRLRSDLFLFAPLCPPILEPYLQQNVKRG